MRLVEFTSYDDIRAALGVSSDEITDATLSLPLYEFNLASEFKQISLTLIADYEIQRETDHSTWSDVQQELHEAVYLFATYAVAKQLTASLPLFSAKEIGDGKASLVRYAQNPYRDTITKVEQAYDTFRSKLVAAYNAVQALTAPPMVVRSYLSVITPARDPVTGT